MEFIPIPPLKNTLNKNPTVYRVIRYLQLNFTLEQYSDICRMVYDSYPSDKKSLKRSLSRMTSSVYRKKVIKYPKEHIPKMIEIIKNQYKIFNPRKKRPRIMN